MSMTVSLNAVLLSMLFCQHAGQFADRQAAPARTPVGGKCQFRSPELCHLIATSTQTKLSRGAKSASWKRSGVSIRFPAAVPRVCLKPATAAQTEMATREGNHVFLLVDGELFISLGNFHRRMISGFHANVSL